MTVIRVDIARGHDVLVGPIQAGLERILEMARGVETILVTEPRVFALHGTGIADALAARPILVSEGEAAKTWDSLHGLLTALADHNATRQTPIIALGGGSVGDLAALAASLFKRGCPIVHIPTTLLSQADSAIGGKTAIDAFGTKNLIGTFHQPALVVADPAFLDTLDQRQLRSGYAEVVKYGLIDDPAFFAWLEANGTGVLAGHRALREQAVAAAIRAKARIVAGDIDDRNGKRAPLNFGHSFAHAIESETGLGEILHGEAVAIGMAMALRLSAQSGLCAADEADRAIAHLVAAGLPTRLTDIGLAGRGAALARWIERDKKNAPGRLTLILTRGIGRAFFDSNFDSKRLENFLSQAS